MSASKRAAGDWVTILPLGSSVGGLKQDLGGKRKEAFYG